MSRGRKLQEQNQAKYIPMQICGKKNLKYEKKNV